MSSVNASAVVLSTPTVNQMFQQNSGFSDIVIEGSYTGTPAAIEARYSNGLWRDIDATMSGGTFSGTLTHIPVGQAVLAVREKDGGNPVEDTISNVGVGNIFIVAGQSNAEGRAVNLQISNSGVTPVTVSATGEWSLFTDPIPAGTYGSCYPLLANNLNYPIAILNLAVGSTAIAQHQSDSDYSDPGPTAARYISGSGVTEARAILWYQGENDANNTDAPLYAGRLQTAMAYYKSMVSNDPPAIIAVIAEANVGGNGQVQQAQIDSWGVNGLYQGPNYREQYPGAENGTYHWATDTEMQMLADDWQAAIEALYAEDECASVGMNWCGSSCQSDYCTANTVVDFNNFPSSVSDDRPYSVYNGYQYSSIITDTKYTWYGSSGYWKPLGVSDIDDSFNLYRNGYNTGHMGYTSFMFAEPDNKHHIGTYGKSLKITVGGGNAFSSGSSDCGTDCGTYGTDYSSKEQYLNNTSDPVYRGGDMYLGNLVAYFQKLNYTGTSWDFYGHTGDSNRMIAWVYLPETVDNAADSMYSWKDINQTFNFAPFTSRLVDTNNDKADGHFYHWYFLRGGGWQKLYVESHAQHNNSWSDEAAWPGPSYSHNSYGTDYFDHTYKFYIASYKGDSNSNEGALLDKPIYDLWIDDMYTEYDTEPQNYETINSVGVMYNEGLDLFEMSWNSKYRTSAWADRTYQVRYSFSPITNANFDSATPVVVEQDDRFRRPINANTNGIIPKVMPYVVKVWGAFKLSGTDHTGIAVGDTVYFAIKDVSQDPTDMTLVNPLYAYGVDYANHLSDTDYDVDEAAMIYIHRSSYTIQEPATCGNMSSKCYTQTLCENSGFFWAVDMCQSINYIASVTTRTSTSKPRSFNGTFR